MNQGLAERRRGALLSLWIAAAILCAIAAVTIGIEVRGLRPDLASGPVLPGLADSIGRGRRILITSSDASYRIERVERGEQNLWVMRDRDDYPVSRGKLEQLTRGLQQLRFTRRMTSDPAKHARLGVDDPRQGGRGVLVQIEDERGALLANLIVGVEPRGGLYVRRPEGAQTWAAAGALPPLREIGAWLDLKPLPVAPERLARVEIQPEQGRAYVLARERPDAGWRLAQPALAPGPGANLAETAQHALGLAPFDVRAAPSVQGAPRARLALITFGGVRIDAELIDADGKTWLKLAARALAPEQEPRALELNAAAGWAFALHPEDVEALAPSLTVLTGGPAVSAGAPAARSPPQPG